MTARERADEAKRVAREILFALKGSTFYGTEKECERQYIEIVSRSIERVISDAEDAERRACAKLADDSWSAEAIAIAAAIRARKEQG